MAEHPHLILPRAEVNIERRRRPGFGSRPDRDQQRQARRVREAVEGVLRRRAELPVNVNPALIVRVKTSGVVPEEQWERAGLTVLGTEADTTVILFASDGELEEFRNRVRDYGEPIPPGQRHPRYASLIGAIDELGTLRPEERIGPLLRRRGVTLDSFEPQRNYTLDVELWDFGTQPDRGARVNELAALIEARGGTVVDRYVGRTLTLFRISAPGTVVRELLNYDDVATVDDPPEPEDLTGELLELAVGDFPPPAPPPDNAPNVGVLDSGLSNAHPLIAAAVGTVVGVPERLRTDDVKGHGTRIAGLVVYGDVQRCAEARTFVPEIRVHSAKVINDAGKFDEQRLVPGQMRDAITQLHAAGCRVFNVSLCDPRNVYAGEKLTAWAATLDELARELDVIIIVSAGNYRIPQPEAEHALRNYPAYLLTEPVRLLDPSTAAIPITVGAIAEAANVPPRAEGNVGLQPVAQPGEPSPFTRSGPGANEAMKPELCDFGGNLVFDGTARDMVRYDECAVMSLNNEYVRRLFSTSVGTSLAAARISHKAAKVFSRFPDNTANLIRALLASSATIPQSAVDRLGPLGADAATRLCGYGVPDVQRATTSDNNRVVLYADAEIAFDRFFVYEVPIPAEFIENAGERYIQVSLAFDPPTRHTRVDYIGTTMSFRLIRGATLEEVIEFYRRRTEDEGPVPDMPGRNNCDLVPGPASREKGTLQRARFTMRQNPRDGYGDTYYLVVRCERKWAPDEEGPQRFAIVVEIGHPAVERLYQRIRERVRVRLRA